MRARCTKQCGIKVDFETDASWLSARTNGTGRRPRAKNTSCQLKQHHNILHV